MLLFMVEVTLNSTSKKVPITVLNISDKMPKKTSKFDNINAAIKAIQDDGMSQKSAAKNFGVARSTLQFKLKNPNKQNISCGPSTFLTTNKEETLKGFPRRREDLQDSVKKILDGQERPNPFKNNLPGIDWYKAFLRRHPILSIRTSEHVINASSNVSEYDIKKWFNDIHSYLTEENLVDILNDGRRVFNGDETGFSLCPKTKCVLGPKESKDIYEVAKGNDKENITVMFSFNAVGQMCHPMVIFKYKRVPQNILDSIPPDWGVGRSDTGWMKSEIFYEYINLCTLIYLFVIIGTYFE
ncbi:hypothetical protein AGLY_012462 [Aphis glycines]|uniref:HTH psq-type domain-containing protein n=1 Tax=Aphis glycines TaxID=307491 RepID=A0A6G0TA45_APHGL|nr:hypothetical protein AGLY_012462 [Aphis glycines]